MDWARILAYVTGTVGQEPLARKEYLAIENRICMAQLNGRLKLSDAEAQILPAPGSAASRSAPHHYAERVCWQLLSLRHYLVANSRWRRWSARNPFVFKGV